ncbi:unnamed protein product [Hymenolepis diminuta]|uniref:Uncharacterized protein n=1 Tax=Hymenolepis diminuta TaxID=6216 RepID=A0A0R3SX68_HYMDI|nr:unnamed protein product [Hymenolepis diminuta]VUZ42149.1 unnamed protein product [Hymenolepis diminuta]
MHNRFDKLINLKEEVIRRNIRHPREIFSAFNVDEVPFLNATLGQCLKEVVKQYIATIDNEKFILEKSQSYIENLQTMTHNCYNKEPKDLELGTNWLMMLLNSNPH